MDIRKIIIGLALSMLLSSGMVGAGPDKTTSLLMDTPASLFDLGMVRLNSLLDQFEFHRFPETPTASASYQWDDDKIRILIYWFWYKGDRQSAKERCLSAFGELRMSSASIDYVTSKPIYNGRSFWADLFGHYNYDKNDLNSELVNLDHKFTFLCSVSFFDKSLDNLYITSSLLSKSYSEIGQ